MAKGRIDKYSLSIRLRSKSGEWMEWQDKGCGVWIGLEHVQKQIAMFKRSFPRDMEVRFERDGKLLDYNGVEIGKAIKYDSR